MFAPEHFNMLINKRFPKNIHKENGKTEYPRLLEKLFLHDSYNCQSLKNFGPCKKNPDKICTKKLIQLSQRATS